jgi:hypothetical protein
MELVEILHKTPLNQFVNRQGMASKQLQVSICLIPKATLQNQRMGKTGQAAIDF